MNRTVKSNKEGILNAERKSLAVIINKQETDINKAVGIVSQSFRMNEDRLVCTYHRTENTWVKQPYFECYTCNIKGETVICGICASVCHSGHDLSPMQEGFVYCDCPSHGVCGIIPPINAHIELDFNSSSNGLNFSQDKLSIECSKSNSIRTSQTRSPYSERDLRKPEEYSTNYFEMKIEKIGGDVLSFGLGKYSHPFTIHPGQIENSYGFFSDGSIYRNGSKIGYYKYHSWNKDDVIGCCLNYKTKQILFSHNGVLIPTLIYYVSETDLIPTIGFGLDEYKISVSFGPFYRYTCEKLLNDIPVYSTLIQYSKPYIDKTNEESKRNENKIESKSDDIDINSNENNDNSENENELYVELLDDIGNILGVNIENIEADLYKSKELDSKCEEEKNLTENICMTAFVIRFLETAEKVYFPEFKDKYDSMKRFINNQSKYVITPAQLGLASTWIQYAAKHLYKYSTLSFFKELRFKESEGSKGCAVFLGGSCNPTTWRKDVAIPMLEEAGISYYNPQVDEWTPDLIEIETEAKDMAHILFFVIDETTRALSSMIEVTEIIVSHRTIVLVIRDIEDGALVEGCRISSRELKDLNRSRAYLRDVACRYGVNVFNDITVGVEHVIAMVQSGL